jgi:hypothetical protein
MQYVILFVALSLFAAFPAYFTQAEDVPPTEETLPVEAAGEKLCGDGTCDSSEEETGKCPQDCGGEAIKNPCGDGTCDDSERETGKCAQDCGAE